ncbi:MAG TPA: YggS family pyridoxal phosphate-dependent enzyme [Acidimicrobiia bacterium]|nr:YggS family pyridoxal phosphate-dependent enzyme [Acidimicrobiia bacterium]
MESVTETAERVGRRPEEITVVAVSKSKSAADVVAIYDLGHRDFGENRAQELVEKAAVLPGDIRWHFVGALQSNKARQVRPSAYLLHSMDRRSLATAWLKGRGEVPPVLLQVNVGEEPQKAGVSPGEVLPTLEWMFELGLDVRGLMAIPPLPSVPEDSRPYFRMLRRLRDEAQLSFPTIRELSMGMSDDYQVAVEEGASIIRVGRAIFGPRD